MYNCIASWNFNYESTAYYFKKNKSKQGIYLLNVMQGYRVWFEIDCKLHRIYKQMDLRAPLCTFQLEKC